METKLTLYSCMKNVGELRLNLEDIPIGDIIAKVNLYAKEQGITYEMIQVNDGWQVLIPISHKLIYATSFAYREGDSIMSDLHVILDGTKPIPIEFLYEQCM